MIRGQHSFRVSPNTHRPPLEATADTRISNNSLSLFGSGRTPELWGYALPGVCAALIRRSRKTLIHTLSHEAAVPLAERRARPQAALHYMKLHCTALQCTAPHTADLYRLP